RKDGTGNRKTSGRTQRYGMLPGRNNHRSSARSRKNRLQKLCDRSDESMRRYCKKNVKKVYWKQYVIEGRKGSVVIGTTGSFLIFAIYTMEGSGSDNG